MTRFLLVLLALSVAVAIIIFLFHRNRRRLDAVALNASIRAQAFAAGYRCAQLKCYRQEFGCEIGDPLVNWEEAERRNAVDHGFTMAEMRP